MNKCVGDGGRSRNYFKQEVEEVYVERLKLSWRGCLGIVPQNPGVWEEEGRVERG